MSAEEEPLHQNRRDFFRSAALATSVIPFIGGPAHAANEFMAPELVPAPKRSDSPKGYIFLSAEEAAFVEALVDTMCPADGLTPSGTDCGLATYFDRQLAGGFGAGTRLYRPGPWQSGEPQLGYQLPLDPAAWFRTGTEGMQAFCIAKHGTTFEQLQRSERERALDTIASAETQKAQPALFSWFDELIYPLFVQACFADPIYGSNADKVFWRMIGYPGLPALYTTDVKTYRGRRHPLARSPKSIIDFS